MHFLRRNSCAVHPCIKFQFELSKKCGCTFRCLHSSLKFSSTLDARVRQITRFDSSRLRSHNTQLAQNAVGSPIKLRFLFIPYCSFLGIPWLFNLHCFLAGEIIGNCKLKQGFSSYLSRVLVKVQVKFFQIICKRLGDFQRDCRRSSTLYFNGNYIFQCVYMVKCESNGHGRIDP